MFGENLIGAEKTKKFRNEILGFIIVIVILATLFGGCIQKQEGLPIVIIGRDSTSGTREFFWQHVMDKEDFSIF